MKYVFHLGFQLCALEVLGGPHQRPRDGGDDVLCCEAPRILAHREHRHRLQGAVRGAGLPLV